jgi:phosphate transport system protein
MTMHLFGSRGRPDALASVEDQLQSMLANDAASLALARAALFEGGDVDEARALLRTTDHQVNLGEQEVRRQLLVHLAVAGPTDAPAVLACMSVVKDVERIGDYAKSLMRLASMGVDFSSAPDREVLVADFDAAVGILPEAAEAFAARDGDRARALVARCEDLFTTCNEAVEAQVASDRPGHHAVPRALTYRHLKRIVAHTTNLLSAVVMPLDQLDHFDEEDRGTADDPHDQPG